MVERIKPKVWPQRQHFRGHIETGGFCQGKFRLSDEEKLMYRTFGKLYRRAEELKKTNDQGNNTNSK